MESGGWAASFTLQPVSGLVRLPSVMKNDFQIVD
jgi:hypothetical protein